MFNPDDIQALEVGLCDRRTQVPLYDNFFATGNDLQIFPSPVIPLPYVQAQSLFVDLQNYWNEFPCQVLFCTFSAPELPRIGYPIVRLHVLSSMNRYVPFSISTMIGMHYDYYYSSYSITSIPASKINHQGKPTEIIPTRGPGLKFKHSPFM
ncbi:hypothetical protein F4604DRAFT_1701931 [Suillus subluteus]|nr:hypothetical protein F4604DRAFT_1701931 [Suillus subluteus]